MEKKYIIKEEPEDFIVREIPVDKVLTPRIADLETEITVVPSETKAKKKDRTQRQIEYPEKRLAELLDQSCIRRASKIHTELLEGTLSIDDEIVLSFDAPASREDRGDLHQSFRQLFPLLRTEAKSDQIVVLREDRFAEIGPLLERPMHGLADLYSYWKRGQPGTGDEPPKKKAKEGVTLILRKNISKDDRRNVYNIVSQVTRKEMQGRTVDGNIELSWKPARSARESTTYLLVLKKRQIEHSVALRTLSRVWRCRVTDIGTGGIKDKQAITFQFLTVSHVPLHKIESSRQELLKKGIELSRSIVPVNWKLSRGLLEGNRFEIKLKGCIDIAEKGLDRQVAKMQRDGFTNFYGEQRVGTGGEGTQPYHIGLSILRGDYSEAIDLLMSSRGEEADDESEAVQAFRNVWKESGGDPKIALKKLPRDGFPKERVILKGLEQFGKDKPLEALRNLNLFERVFWVNAYQSHVWNHMAAARLEESADKIIDGDLLLLESGDVTVANSSNMEVFSLHDVVLPMPGYNIEYPKNRIGEEYRKFLEKDGVHFDSKSDNEHTPRGTYRSLKVKVNDFKVAREPDSQLSLCFAISKGSYATVFVDQLLDF